MGTLLRPKLGVGIGDKLPVSGVHVYNCVLIYAFPGKPSFLSHWAVLQ